MYVPKHKRQFGYYVMPVLSWDQLIGRVYPGWTGGGACSPSDPAVAAAIETLALFAGAGSVSYSGEAVHWLLDHHL